MNTYKGWAFTRRPPGYKGKRSWDATREGYPEMCAPTLKLLRWMVDTEVWRTCHEA